MLKLTCKSCGCKSLCGEPEPGKIVALVCPQCGAGMDEKDETNLSYFREYVTSGSSGGTVYPIFDMTTPGEILFGVKGKTDYAEAHKSFTHERPEPNTSPPTERPVNIILGSTWK